MLVFKGNATRRYIPKFGWVFLNENTTESILKLAKEAGIGGIEETEIGTLKRGKYVGNVITETPKILNDGTESGN